MTSRLKGMSFRRLRAFRKKQSLIMRSTEMNLRGGDSNSFMRIKNWKRQGLNRREK
jgi:hypothetical protein